MLAAFTYRDFRVQWFGACTSSIGTWVQLTAQNWMVLSLTGSAFFLGLDSFLQQLPIMLFTLVGGVLADRRDRRRTLLGSQYVQMATATVLALLVYFDLVTITYILMLSFTTGLAQAFGGPAYQSLVPSLVDKKDLPNAVALNSIQFNIARVLGPLLFAATLSFTAGWGFGEQQSMAVCFALNAVSFLVVINTLMALRVKHIPPAQTRSMRDELQGGISYVRQRRELVALIILAATTTFLGFAVLTFLPVFTKSVFQGDARTYSHLLAFSGAGSVVGALIVAWLGKFKRMGRTALLMQAFYGMFIVAFALVADAVVERRAAVPHRRGADGGVLDGDVARAAHRAERNARTRDEHLHGGVSRRHAARQPGERLRGDLHQRAERARDQRRPAGAGGRVFPHSQPRDSGNLNASGLGL